MKQFQNNFYLEFNFKCSNTFSHHFDSLVCFVAAVVQLSTSFEVGGKMNKGVKDQTFPCIFKYCVSTKVTRTHS